MKHAKPWAIGIGLVATVGLLTVKQGYGQEEEKGHVRTCSLER
jgi:hypothetical protein